MCLAFHIPRQRPVVVLARLCGLVRTKSSGSQSGGCKGVVVAAEDSLARGGVDVLEQRRGTVSGVVIVLIQSLELVDLVFTTSEERPEDLDQGEQEDDTSSDGDRDEDDDTRREEIYMEASKSSRPKTSHR